MCNHDNTTELLFAEKLNRYTAFERSYEVVFCRDCNRLINYYQEEPMTADQVEMLFKDIKAGFEHIDAAANDLTNAIIAAVKPFRELDTRKP